jgi:hypothetical protein
VPRSAENDTLEGDPTQPYIPMFTGEFPAQPDPVQPLAAEHEPLEAPTGPLPSVVQPEIVPGTYQYLKRWTFVLVVAGVWIVGAACGLGLYYWWFHTLDKTAPVFVTLLFLMACSVGGLLTAMVGHKPVVAALAIGLMSAPLAAMAAAAVLHGLYFCDLVSRCFVGLVPY